jgi:hypothetical protein
LAAPASPAGVTLTLKDHRFSPAEFTVPAGEPVVVTLINLDPAVEECESRELGVEQGITPKGHASFTIGPLKPGDYHFMGELHTATAQGKIAAVGH